ncbi:hypothetical protein V6B14_22290 (plasmid) [Sporosarcina psychrophila]|uniref:hypothetical protein n=1 Tax=Sporosarcina psychrophila TaxID=1476 RepID=UPI0030D4E71F
MPNIISKVFAVILLVFVMIFVPIYQSYQRQDDLAQQVAYQAVTDFVDNVRTKGYISPKMIEDFETRLELGSYLFKSEFVHEKKVYTPIYTDPTNPATFTGDYVVDYDEYHKGQIMPYLFTESSSVPKQDRKYQMTAGDFFFVNVENMTRSKSSMLFDFFTGGNSGDGVTIVVPYGGMVLNEDY